MGIENPDIVRMREIVKGDEFLKEGYNPEELVDYLTHFNVRDFNNDELRELVYLCGMDNFDIMPVNLAELKQPYEKMISDIFEEALHELHNRTGFEVSFGL